jgi:allantoate deiminase
MDAPDADLGRAIMGRLAELAKFSAEPHALTRRYLSPEHRAAAEQVRDWMRAAGMDAEIDATGTVAGRYDSAPPGAASLLVGSHIDTVRDAGRYDGTLGVVAAIAAVGALHRAGERLPFTIEVLAFGDEEGSRFPVTLTGSRAVAGLFDLATLNAVDFDGIRLADALRAFGCDAAQIPAIARRKDRVLAYVELHIEQGPVLEAQGLPVGVVTAIAGGSRFKVAVEGVAGHAGTVPMHLRRDAVCAAAEMILAVEQLATQTDQLVATTGVVQADPGAVNVIASGAFFTLDIRSASDSVRTLAVQRLEQSFRAIGRKRRVGVEIRRTYDQPAAVCDPALVAQFEAAVARAGVTPLALPSGAGHDGLAMRGLCPIGMLFVRCKGGISHNPAESITAADAATAAGVLLDFIRQFDPSGLRRA